MYLNHDLGLDEVRWLTTRKASYDSLPSFSKKPEKILLQPGTKLYRLEYLPTGKYFGEVWWMPEKTFNKLEADVNMAEHGGGRLLRNYIADGLSLPKANDQRSVIKIELVQPVYAWSGKASSLFNRHGGSEQIYLPHLLASGDPRWSDHARVVTTYWLRF